MKNFHDVMLPDFIAVHAVGGPAFSTTCVTTISGRESRASAREIGLQQYVIYDCKLSVAEFEIFNSFFRARRGQQYSFYMRDHADYSIDNQRMTECDENKIVFEIYKEYPDPFSPYCRRITKLDQNSISTNILTEVDCKSGIIILPRPLLPSQELILSAKFYVPVRFMSDVLKYHVHIDGSVIIDEMTLLEVV